MISEVDQDNNGYITFKEFVPLISKVLHDDLYLEEELTQVFMNFGYEKQMLTSHSLMSRIFIASNEVLAEGKL